MRATHAQVGTVVGVWKRTLSMVCAVCLAHAPTQSRACTPATRCAGPDDGADTPLNRLRVSRERRDVAGSLRRPSQPAINAHHGGTWDGPHQRAGQARSPPATPASRAQEDRDPAIELPSTRIVLPIERMRRNRLRLAKAFCVGRLRGTARATPPARRWHDARTAPGCGRRCPWRRCARAPACLLR